MASYSSRQIWVTDDLYDDKRLGLAQYRLTEKPQVQAQPSWTRVHVIDLMPKCLDSLGSNGKLYIIGHGSPTRVGNMTPTQMAQKLVSDGAIPSGTTIRLVSCNTGFSKYNFWADSFAKKLRAELL